MLTEAEITQAKLYANGDWSKLAYDSVTNITTWVRKEVTGTNSYKLHFRETMPADLVIKNNAEAQKQWTGWHGKEDGAIVASIPIPIYHEMRNKAGWDGHQYDQNKFNALLNDPDYRAFRTGGGRLQTRNRKMT